MAIYDDPKVYDESIPFIERRRYVLTRRAEQFIHWITIAEYEDDRSVAFLINRVTQITEALNQSIDKEDWQDYQYRFNTYKNKLQVDIGRETDQERYYNFIRQDIIGVLTEYREFVEQLSE